MSNIKKDNVEPENKVIKQQEEINSGNGYNSTEDIELHKIKRKEYHKNKLLKNNSEDQLSELSCENKESENKEIEFKKKKQNYVDEIQKNNELENDVEEPHDKNNEVLSDDIINYSNDTKKVLSHHNSIPSGMRYNEARSGQLDDADLTDAMLFLNKIKEDYTDNIHVYDQFLETMRDFKFGKIESGEVCKRIRLLFKDNLHLINLFEEYLPQHLKLNANKSGYSSQINHIPPHQNMHRQMPLGTMYHSNLNSNHIQMLRNPSYYRQRPMSVLMNNYPGSISSQRPVFRGYQSIPYELYRPMNPNSINPQNVMSPKLNNNIHVMNDNIAKKDRQQIFIDKLKKKYSPTSTIYNNIIDAMLNQNVDTDSLFKYIKMVLKDDSELIDEFKMCYNFECKKNEKLPKEVKEKIILDKIKTDMEEKGLLNYFISILNYYNQNLINEQKLFYLLENLIKKKEYIQELKSLLKYCEHNKKVKSQIEQFETIGSYIKNKSKNVELNQHSLLINTKYSCVSTHVSEDDVFIFRQKNISEEYLIKLGDDRSEFDVQIQRLKYFLCKMMKLYALLPEDPKEIDINDIEMSSSILKEVLKTIYGTEFNVILEKILIKGKIAIPQVIKRTCIVYKEFLAKQRENRFNWRIAIESHYYKAYDIDGIEFKNNERNSMNNKNLKDISKNKFEINVDNIELIDLLYSLVKIFVDKQHNSNNRITLEQKNNFIDNIFNNIRSSSCTYSINLEYYTLYYYILTLYARYQEVFQLNIPIDDPSPIAIKLGLAEKKEFDTFKHAIITLSTELVAKQIDSDTFEEKIRIYTKSLGYKLYNLKKIFLKIDKLIASIVEKIVDNNEQNMDLYYINKEHQTILLKSNKGIDGYEDIGSIS